jgi:hypothetical protein
MVVLMTVCLRTEKPSVWHKTLSNTFEIDFESKENRKKNLYESFCPDME